MEGLSKSYRRKTTSRHRDGTCDLGRQLLELPRQKSSQKYAKKRSNHSSNHTFSWSKTMPQRPALVLVILLGLSKSKLGSRLGYLAPAIILSCPHHRNLIKPSN